MEKAKFFRIKHILVHLSRQSCRFLGKNIFSFASPSKTSALPFDFTLERDPKNIFYYHWGVENYTDLVIDFLFFDKHKYKNEIFKLLVCNFDQYIYVRGLYNFFFALQDLIDRINSYFQRIAFYGKLLLIAF